MSGHTTDTLRELCVSVLVLQLGRLGLLSVEWLMRDSGRGGAAVGLPTRNNSDSHTMVI